MAVKKVPEAFATECGKRFKSVASAKRHEDLDKAAEQFACASRWLGKCLAESQLTADGERFEFGVFRDYYHIARWFGMPGLRMISMMGISFEWNCRDGQFMVRERAFDNEKDPWVSIGSLYRSQAKAKEALVEALKKYRDEIDDEINKATA